MSRLLFSLGVSERHVDDVASECFLGESSSSPVVWLANNRNEQPNDEETGRRGAKGCDAKAYAIYTSKTATLPLTAPQQGNPRVRICVLQYSLILNNAACNQEVWRLPVPLCTDRLLYPLIFFVSRV